MINIIDVNKKRSVNLFIVSGLVVTNAEKKKSRKRLFARTRLRIAQGSTYAYVDMFGYGDTALKMNLICQRGNMVLVEAHLCTKIYTNKQGEVKGKMYFMVDSIELVYKANEKDIRELTHEDIELIDELDPENYL